MHTQADINAALLAGVEGESLVAFKDDRGRVRFITPDRAGLWHRARALTVAQLRDHLEMEAEKSASRWN